MSAVYLENITCSNAHLSVFQELKWHASFCRCVCLRILLWCQKFMNHLLRWCIRAERREQVGVLNTSFTAGAPGLNSEPHAAAAGVKRPLTLWPSDLRRHGNQTGVLPAALVSDRDFTLLHEATETIQKIHFLNWFSICCPDDFTRVSIRVTRAGATQHTNTWHAVCLHLSLLSYKASRYSALTDETS